MTTAATQTDFDAATAEVADLTDEAIDAMVREEPRAAEVLVARVMGFQMREHDGWFNVRAPKGYSADYYGQGGHWATPKVAWQETPRPLTDPAATLALLEWAVRAYPRTDLTAGHLPDGTFGGVEVALCGTGGVGLGIAPALAPALVTAVLKAAAREARQAKRDAEKAAEPGVQTAYSG